MQSLYLKGLVALDENNQTKMNYIITNEKTNKQTSLTDILDTIYNSTNSIKKLIRVAGKICCNGHSFHCFEGLHIQKETKYINSYFVGNFPLEKQLYQLAEFGEEVEIIIEDYTNSIGEFIDATEDTPYAKTTCAS